jgi:hypothetical protein
MKCPACEGKRTVPLDSVGGSQPCLHCQGTGKCPRGCWHMKRLSVGEKEDLAKSIKCPKCKAEPGEPCTNSITGEHGGGFHRLRLLVAQGKQGKPKKHPELDDVVALLNDITQSEHQYDRMFGVLQLQGMSEVHTVKERAKKAVKVLRSLQGDKS